MRERLEKLPFWHCLSVEEKTIIAEAAVVRRFSAGSQLHGSQGGLGMMMILSGQVPAYLLSFEGREMSLFYVSRGECCVLSASCMVSQLQFNTQVTEEADILIIPSDVFRKLADGNVHVRCFMYELMTQRFSSVLRIMEQLLFSRFDQRLAAYLVEAYHKTGKTELKMTQEQIARNVNSAREVVSRTLKRFAVDGLIESRRGLVLLKDIQGLRTLAG